MVLLERKNLKRGGVYALLGLPKSNFDYEKNVKEVEELQLRICSDT